MEEIEMLKKSYAELEAENALLRQKLNNKTVIESITIKNPYTESTKVIVNGQLIGEGVYGGEPEDNIRSRDYKWVETTLVNLANALGSKVEFSKIVIPDFEEV